MVSRRDRLQALASHHLNPGQAAELIEPGVRLQPLGHKDPLDVARPGRLDDGIAPVDELGARPRGGNGWAAGAIRPRPWSLVALGPGTLGAGSGG
ncbi:MAG: hypothetical protein NVS9B1_18110 [Candidatus Dormibacteraceae bacterium]